MTITFDTKVIIAIGFLRWLFNYQCEEIKGEKIGLSVCSALSGSYESTNGSSGHAKKIVMWNARHNIGVKVVLKFEDYLKKLTEKKEVKALHSKIKAVWGWFETIRKVLRVCREFSTNEQDVSPTKVNEMEKMQEITESEVLDARRLIRTFPQSPLIRSDSERPGILRDFIRLVDDAFEDVLDRDVDGWLSNFQTDAIMTL